MVSLPTVIHVICLLHVCHPSFADSFNLVVGLGLFTSPDELRRGSLSI